MSKFLTNGGRRVLWATALMVGCGAAASADTITTIYANNDVTGDAVSNTGLFPSFLPASQAIGSTDWSYADIYKGGTVGINTTYAKSGNGSAYFSTTGATPDAFFGSVGTANMASVKFEPGGSLGTLSDLTTFGYDWLLHSSNSATAAPALRLLLSNGKSLVWEPTYNGFGSSIPQDEWTTSNAFNGGNGVFWYTGDQTSPSNPNPVHEDSNKKDYRYITLSQWLNDATVKNLSITGISVGVGSSSGLEIIGAADNIRIGFNDGPVTTYNFEVDGAPYPAVPEPSSVAMGLIAGAAGLVMAARRRRSA